MTMHWAIAHTIEESVGSSLNYQSPLSQYIWKDLYPPFWEDSLDQQTKTHEFDDIFREIFLHQITGIITPQLENSLLDLQEILPNNSENIQDGLSMEDRAKKLWLRMRKKAISMMAQYMNTDEQEKILNILGYNSDLAIIKQNRLVKSFIEWCDDDKPITPSTQAISKEIITRSLHCIREQRVHNKSSSSYRR